MNGISLGPRKQKGLVIEQLGWFIFGRWRFSWTLIQVEIKIQIRTYTEKNHTKRIEVNHGTELGVDISLTVPMNLENNIRLMVQ